jgi:WD40 repeat protein
LKSDGTQLAAICFNGLIAVWNYPNNDKLFKYSTKISQHSKIVWNPFDPNVLAVYKV